jgi:tetratricopeptide (TPR) repeat protein
MIRELDDSDVKLVEDELGSRLRAIEFIFSAAGVNRPLTPSDDSDKNLNKTNYRDQINKVAYAIKEVIYGMHPDKEKRMSKTYKVQRGSRQDQARASAWSPGEKTRPRFSKWISYSSMAAVLILAFLLFIYPGWLQGEKSLSISGGDMQYASIAVLPVSNLIGDTLLDWIPMSIHDDIITPLSTTRDLVVRPKQSTMQYKNSDDPIPSIAKELQVSHILETAVKGGEEALRLEVRLVGVKPKEHYIWTKTYNTSWEEIAGLYPEIISQIFRKMNIGLSKEQESKIQVAKDSDPEVKKLCARGEYYMKKLNKEDFQKGLVLLQEAIDLDPADPLPYITLSKGYSITSHIADIDPEGYKLSRAYAQKALDLDSMNIHSADAYVSLGSNALYFQWDFNLAKRYLSRALELNPNNAAAHYHYGWYMTLEGEIDSAVSEFHRSIEIDPLSLYYTHNIAWYNIFVGDFEGAVAPARKTLEMNPDYAYGKSALGLAYVELGRYEEGLQLQREALEKTNAFEHWLGISYERMGIRDSALAVAERLIGYDAKWFYAGLSQMYAVMGDKEKAMIYVEKAYEAKQDFVAWFGMSHYLKPIHDHPRLKEILESLNLPGPSI